MKTYKALRLFEANPLLKELARKLFDITPIKITGDIKVPPPLKCTENVTVLELPLDEKYSKANLDYQKNEQGRDTFDVFLGTVFQVGAANMQEEKDERIESLKCEIKVLRDERSSNWALIKELRQRQLPEGKTEDELAKAREDIDSLKKKVNNLQLQKCLQQTKTNN